MAYATLALLFDAQNCIMGGIWSTFAPPSIISTAVVPSLEVDLEAKAAPHRKGYRIAVTAVEYRP